MYKQMEQQVIIEKITALFNGADTRNWEQVRNTMAATVLLDYTSMAGGEPATLTPAQITEAWAAFLPGFDSTLHQLSDFTVALNDTGAAVHFSGKADHFIGTAVWTVAGTYDAALQQQNGMWQVTSLRLNLGSISGDTTLPVQAAQRVQAK
jgi:hypothetical protein